MVYDMKNGKFVIDLDNIHSLIEIGQVNARTSFTPKFITLSEPNAVSLTV